ncbi:hypothetical protein QOZ88_18640 [Blastococcus sp. BMG 814]|uniref:Uncharacterized protein n=1 Tax=Blastococcus carthaginiensis TaxID=3050034 RepID=A0ABT9IHW3_9ACTN|nr:hypothetical protein [Blastococcus carthaginiensis]MDP5184660.1 hypothetical protein [Blastococcus carthaginiensis]
MGTMLLWPAAAVLGFLLCTAVVVALGASSTARYEYARATATQHTQRAAARASGTHPAGRRAAAPAAGGDGQLRPHGVAVAARPAEAPAPARVAVAAPGTGHGWWLVDEGAQVLAGPFDDRIDADWAALSGGLAAVSVYGAPRADGSVAPRPSPADRAWLAELGDQLDRLPEDWDALLTDTDPLTTLVVEVAAALVEAGLPLHDAAGAGTSGGVCLVPEAASCGVLVSWRTHDRMGVQLSRGDAALEAVQELMDAALADTLTELGFVVQTFGASGVPLVTAVR